MTVPPFESQWDTPEKRARWAAVLEKVGAENVRARLAQADFGSAGAMAIGTEHTMTKGYAEEWLAHHDAQVREADERHRAFVAKWTKAAAIGAIAAAGFALLGAAAAACQAVFAYMALPK